MMARSGRNTVLTRWLPALALALLIAGPLAPANAQTATDADPQAAQAALIAAIAAAASDDDAGEGTRDAIRNHLLAAGGRDGIGKSAVALMRALADSALADRPLAFQNVSDALSGAASEALSAAAIVSLTVLDSFSPADGAIALDFGPPDSAAGANFSAVGARDERLAGDSVRALRRPDGNPLQVDGIVNPGKLRIEVPNGTYRIYVFSDNIGDGTSMTRPFGEAIVAEGASTAVAPTRPENWQAPAYLTSAGDPDRAGDPAQLPGQAQGTPGGMILLEVEVSDGVLDLNFLPAADSDVYLTGLIVEPANGPSSIVLSQPARAALRPPLDSILEVEAQLAEATAETIAQIASAAGPETRAALLDLGDPPTPPGNVSEN